MMTPGNLWFEVRFEIGMLGRGSDIGGREYWGARSQATKAGDSGGLRSPPHEMSCHVRSGFPSMESLRKLHSLLLKRPNHGLSF